MFQVISAAFLFTAAIHHSVRVAENPTRGRCLTHNTGNETRPTLQFVKPPFPAATHTPPHYTRYSDLPAPGLRHSKGASARSDAALSDIDARACPFTGHRSPVTTRKASGCAEASHLTAAHAGCELSRTATIAETIGTFRCHRNPAPRKGVCNITRIAT